MSTIRVEAVTPGRWSDLEQLFGERGAVDGCWCMWFRESGDEYRRNRGAGNRESMRRLVEGDARPGLIAYVDDVPAAWCAVAPRDAYPRLKRSPVTRPVDSEPAWSVVCFFTHQDFRGQGLADRLLQAAVQFAAENGAALVEGYPVSPQEGQRLAPDAGFHGFESAFRRAGFEEAARRKPARPIMRHRPGSPAAE